jgi:two-component system alkaline phosphatase synthesis response regulator PhoP
MEIGGEMAQNRVLIVDDEPRITEVLRVYLERDGFQVADANNGRQAIERAASYKPDLIILDLNLPDIDGLEVCRTIRKSSGVPIIMLTGRGEEVDRVVGLELGADDYVTKPFSAREIVARVRAVLRRQAAASPAAEKVTIGNLVIDSARYQAACRGRRLDLTTTEFKLLAALAESPGRVYSRANLLDAVQGIDYEGYERNIDAHVKNLRQKMAANPEACGCRIETVRGVGYKLEVDAGAD